MDFKPDKVVVPPLELPGTTSAEFAALWERHRARPGEWVDYDLEAPKSLFLRWLAESEGCLLHGTGDDAIEVFEPRDQTDVAQRSVHGVFAASDGIWPMYFAIVNRAGRPGSLRNGCARRADGSRVYHFSINAAWLDDHPWRDGVIYVFDPEGFRRCKGADGTETEEWVNESPVAPVAKLRVEPGDFPFLDRVTGHDDSDIFGFFNALESAVTSAVTATRVDEGWLFEFAPDAARIDELAELCGQAWRSSLFADLTVALECRSSQGPVRLRCTGSPAFDATVAHWLDDSVAADSPGR